MVQDSQTRHGLLEGRRGPVLAPITWFKCGLAAERFCMTDGAAKRDCGSNRMVLGIEELLHASDRRLVSVLQGFLGERGGAIWTEKGIHQCHNANTHSAIYDGAEGTCMVRFVCGGTGRE